MSFLIYQHEEHLQKLWNLVINDNISRSNPVSILYAMKPMCIVLYIFPCMHSHIFTVIIKHQAIGCLLSFNYCTLVKFQLINMELPYPSYIHYKNLYSLYLFASRINSIINLMCLFLFHLDTYDVNICDN